jgi:lipoprotein-releasing system permease protein
MNWPYELQIGWRYTRAGRAGRRNGFISFISGVSMLGIALGVAALIIVLSVMNGFRKEVQGQMLAAVPHIEVSTADGDALPDWKATLTKIQAVPQAGAQVIGAAPFISTQALLARGDEMRGVILRGISPQAEASVTDVAARLKDTVLARLVPGQWNVVLGIELARSLRASEGDQVTAVLPGGQVTPAGVVPRMRALNVVGVFNSGHYPNDNGLALVHIDDAARLMRVEGPTGLQLRLRDLNDARDVAARLQGALGPGSKVTDWTRSNASWFDAVQVEKLLMFIILTLIVAVAAFNLVAMLVMTVTDKRADIAILRTLGASPRSVMGVFMIQGAASGVIGTAAGVFFGLLVAFNIDVIVPAIEQLLSFSFFPGNVFLISRMPSDPQRGDIVPVIAISLLLSFIATLYPSWRASRVQPAQALRYE